MYNVMVGDLMLSTHYDSPFIKLSENIKKILEYKKFEKSILEKFCHFVLSKRGGGGVK
jgi:hypothetical protein